VSALGTPDAARAADARLRREGTRVLEREIGGLVEERGADGFLAGHGVDGYRELARLGAPAPTTAHGPGPGPAGGGA
jgi:hypothetical protein